MNKPQPPLIVFSRHAQTQMQERGTDETEVVAAIHSGTIEPARNNRMLYRKNFQFDALWRGRSYRIKQVAPVVVAEADQLVVVTVYVFYY